MADASTPFRLAYVPGVTPGKWVRLWEERVPEVPLVLDLTTTAEAVDRVRDRRVDAALLRLPVDKAGLHAIPLYTETTVVVFPKDHLLAATDEVATEDIADSVVLRPADDAFDGAELPGEVAGHRPETTKDAVELVAAGVGLLVVPQSLARLHHRRDLTYRPLADAPVSSVALTWLEDETTDLVEQLIGIVRGRTPNSTRGRPQTPPARKKKPAPTARRAAPERRGTPSRRGKPRRRS